MSGDRHAETDVFTAPESWSGGSYELALVLGPPNDERLRAARNALWDFDAIDGCFLDNDREPGDQQRRSPQEFDPERMNMLRGVARLEGGAVACRDYIVRGRDDEEDWLYFGLPLGSLGRILPVQAFPFDDGSSLDWRSSLDAWLFEIAKHVFERVQFRVGLIGWVDAADADDGIPDDRWCGIVEPREGRLVWHAPNMGAPFH